MLWRTGPKTTWIINNDEASRLVDLIQTDSVHPAAQRVILIFFVYRHRKRTFLFSVTRLHAGSGATFPLRLAAVGQPDLGAVFTE